MSQHERELTYLENVSDIDTNLVNRVSQWKSELPMDQYKERIRELMDDLADTRDWVGKEGDNATRLHMLTKDHL